MIQFMEMETYQHGMDLAVPVALKHLRYTHDIYQREEQKSWGIQGKLKHKNLCDCD